MSDPSDSPVRPLLVKHPISTLLTPYRIALLQRNFIVAVAAEILYRARGVFESVAGAGDVEAAGLRAAGGAGVGCAASKVWRGVLFAGHGCGWLWVLICGGCSKVRETNLEGLEGEDAGIFM